MTCWLNVNEISVEKWRCFTAERLAVKFYYRRNKHTRFGGDDGQEFFVTVSHSSSLRSDLCSGGIPWCIWWRWLRSGCWCSPSQKAEWRNRPPGGEWREWIVCQWPWAPGQPPSSYTHLSHWVCVDLFLSDRDIWSALPVFLCLSIPGHFLRPGGITLKPLSCLFLDSQPVFILSFATGGWSFNHSSP